MLRFRALGTGTVALSPARSCAGYLVESDGLRLLIDCESGVTHHLADIIPEIERVILIKRGRIVDDGPKEALLTSARLTELFGVRIEVGRRGDFYHAW